MVRSDYREWLKRADDDPIAMQRLIPYDYTPYNVVCYHAQQYAEKIVKAKILELGGDFDYVHDIVVLLADFEKKSLDYSGEKICSNIEQIRGNLTLSC